MVKQHYTTNINASREKIWDILWSDQTYREWTSVFSEGSHVETDWKEGSKVLFLDGQGSGMVSRIAANRPHEYMSFEHLGEINNGVEDFTSDKVKNWAGAHENYTLKTVNGYTELSVEVDMDDQFADMFKGIFPKALAKVKELAEA